MKFRSPFKKLFEKRSDPVLSRDDLWLEVGRLAASGSTVTPDTAIQHAAVYACKKAISETLATLPGITYRRLENGGKERASDLNIYHLLATSPNANLKMSSVDFIEALSDHILFRGNAYAQAIVSATDVERLIILDPDKVIVKVEKSISGENTVSYSYRSSANKIELDPGLLLHIKDSAPDGILGKSRIDQQRDTIGLALAKDTYEANLYKQGTRLSGVLEHPETLSDGALDRIGKGFREAYSGNENMHKVAILEEGMTFKAMAMTNSDAEFVASRKLSVIDICRIFRVPPAIIAELTGANYASVEHEFMKFVIQAVRPMAVRMEMAINRDILPLAYTRGRNEQLFFEFLIAGLLRGDQQTRYQSYKIGLGYGFLSPNDVRKLENMNPIDGGDRYYIPANNMVPLDRIDEYLDAKIQKDISKSDDLMNDQTVAPQEPGDQNVGREKEYLDALKQLREGYQDIFLDAISLGLTKEVNDIKRKKTLEAISDYYSNYAEKFVANLRGVSNSFLDAACLLAATCSVKVAKRVDIDEFLSSYAEGIVGKRKKILSEDADIEVIKAFLLEEKTFAATERDELVEQLINKFLKMEE